jgi:hypothetical protein
VGNLKRNLKSSVWARFVASGGLEPSRKLRPPRPAAALGHERGAGAYNVNIAGGFGAAQLTSDYVVANGVHLPTKRRAYTRGPGCRPHLEMLMGAIDISEVTFK